MNAFSPPFRLFSPVFARFYCFRTLFAGTCQPAVFRWLQASPPQQLAWLLNAMHECQWTAVAEQDGLAALLDLPYIAFVQQGKGSDRVKANSFLFLRSLLTCI